MTPLRRLVPRLLAMVATALVLAWGTTVLLPIRGTQPAGNELKTALILSGIAASPFAEPLLARLAGAPRD